MEEKHTIRTSTGNLFGEFGTREEAWEAIKRVRKSGHDALDVATVVPLLAGVTPKPMHPGWLSDDYVEPASKLHYTDADVQALVKRAAELVTELEQTREERDRFREHSVTLNSVAFAMAQALGDVPPGADSVEGDPLEQAARLVGAVDLLKLTTSTLERRTAQLDEACAEVERLEARLREAQDRPWQNQ